MRRHAAAHVVGRGRSRAIGSTDTGVVLRTAPRETDARVADRIALHLVDGHLSGMTVDELDEAATFARRNLDIGNLAETLEEGTQLVLGDVARETANENGGVVGVGELVHGLHGVELALTIVVGDAPHGSGGMTGNRRHHLVATLAVTVLVGTVAG